MREVYIIIEKEMAHQEKLKNDINSLKSLGMIDSETHSKLIATHNYAIMQLDVVMDKISDLED